MPSSNDKTQTTTNNLWGPVQDQVSNLLNNTGRVYGQMSGGSLPPINQTTKYALQGTVNAAKKKVPGLKEANALTQGLMTNGGMTSGMQNAADVLGGYAANNGMTADLQKTAGYLDQFASGQYQEDPRLAAAIKAREDRTANALSTSFGGGRYGSAAIGKNFASGMADAGNELMLQSNENARNRQLQASGMLDGLYQNAANRGASAAGAMGSLYSQGADNALQAATLVPGLNDLRYDGLSRRAGVGDYKQNRADANANYQWSQLQNYAGILGPMMGANTTRTVTQPGPSAAQSVLGGIGAGAKFGSAFGPWGTLIGGAGGGILGAFG